MSKDQADDAVSEPSKFSGTKLRFSSTENIWSEANDKRFGNLSQAYAEQRDEMSRDDVLEFCRLSMKKNQILEDKKKSKTKHRQSKEAETPLKGSYFGASASSNWADEMDADDIRKSRDKKMDKQHRRDPSSGSSTNSDDDSCSDTHSSGSSDESGEDVPQTMSEVERRLGKMIERKFYNLVDSDRTQSKDGELRPPKLGTKRALSDKLERELKSSGRNLQFGDKTSNSKPLRFVLEQHRSFSSRGRLNNKASINLLLRFLNSQPFTMVNSLRNSGADVGLIYSQLQTAYRDVLDPQQATKALDAFLESPSLVQLTKVSAKILELSSLVHQFESKKTRALNIQVTATSYFQQYLNRYYSRQDSCRVNDQLLRWKSRNTSLANPLQIYFQLGSIASTQLIGMLPSYARNLGAKRPEDRPPRAPYPPNQHQHQVQQVLEDLGDFSFDSASQISDQDFRDYQQQLEDQETEMASVLAANEASGGQPRYRCLLCNMDNHPGATYAFWKSCPYFKGLTPTKERKPCCNGRHPPVLKCASPLARKDTTREKEKVKVYS